MMDILIGVICILGYPGVLQPIPLHWSRIENLHINRHQVQCDALYQVGLSDELVNHLAGLVTTRLSLEYIFKRNH